MKTFGCLIFFPDWPVIFNTGKIDRSVVAKSGIGRLIHDKRTSCGITKRALAKRLNIHPDVVGLWERGIHQPRVGQYPAIMKFLGGPRISASQTLAEKIIKARYLMGWSQEKMADYLGVSERSVARWEKGQEPPIERASSIEMKISPLSDPFLPGRDARQ